MLVLNGSLVTRSRTDTLLVSTVPSHFALSRESKLVFVGLMVGMLVGSISQTMVSPAMPVIVAELGGMKYYSWLATSAMLASAVIVPVVGKLSDLYGRRIFYISGLAIFLTGTALSGFATSFAWLVGARVVQGIGMGTLMPLSQVIIGAIIAPRQRGRYQRSLGAVFGVPSVAGPRAGGFSAAPGGWRWRIFVSLPRGLLALAFIGKFLKLPHTPRKAVIAVPGILLLSGALMSILLGTSWGGVTYPWGAWQVLTAFGIGAVLLAVLIPVELRAVEPVIPLRLFKDSTFTISNIASLTIGMAMFGAIFYIPVYAQGVMGADVTSSGAIVMPMSLAMILTSIVVGLLITRTGKYKPFMVAATFLIVGVYVLLAHLTYGDAPWQLMLAMVVLGTGLGGTMSTYVLVVQNTARPKDLGIATSATQFFRSAGATVGIAVFGTIWTSRVGEKVATHLPAGAEDAMPAGGVDVGSVLDPGALAQLPAPVAEAIRNGLADALHDVFVFGIPIVLIAVIATLFLKVLPLRDTLHTADPKEKVEDALAAEVASEPAPVLAGANASPSEPPAEPDSSSATRDLSTE